MNLNIHDINLEDKPQSKKEYIEITMKCDGVYSHFIDDLGIIDQEKNILDYKIVRCHLEKLGRLSSKQALKIIYDSMEVLKKDPNVVQLTTPAYVLGDIHGQFFDLLNILDTLNLSKDKVVLMGDYVDRGFYSTEVYLYLLLLKTHFPNNIVLLRGNHECKIMTSKFTFRKECLTKYNEKVYEQCLESFKTLPLCALIQNNIFCVHGGISKDLPTIKDINKLNRFCELKIEGPMCDLLWSDPNPDFYKGDSYTPNKRRHCAYLYNYSDVNEFLTKNELKCIVRGHEAVKDGYQLYYKSDGDLSDLMNKGDESFKSDEPNGDDESNKEVLSEGRFSVDKIVSSEAVSNDNVPNDDEHKTQDMKPNDTPQQLTYLNPFLIILFSAPNYCDTYKNKGAILFVDDNALEIKTFKETSRPFTLPNNLDGINWTFPFIGEKIAEFYIDLMKNIDLIDLTPQDLEDETNKIENEIIKAQNCVVAIALIRAERENMTELNFDFVQTISMNTIRTPSLQDYPFEEIKAYDEANLSVPKNKVNEKGVSMNISESLKPAISREAANRTIDDVIHNSEIQIDSTTDNATVNIKNKKQNGSYYSCCL